MHLVHDPPDGPPRTIATRVTLADSFLRRARGLMFRRSFPDDAAMVFRFDVVRARTIHMAFVPFPIDVLWVRDGAVERVARLRPWRGIGRGRGDTVVELPAGNADGIDVGDGIELVRDADRGR